MPRLTRRVRGTSQQVTSRTTRSRRHAWARQPLWTVMWHGQAVRHRCP